VCNIPQCHCVWLGSLLIIDHFKVQIMQLARCVSLSASGRTITFELNYTFDLDIFAPWFILTPSRFYVGQGHRSKFKVT